MKTIKGRVRLDLKTKDLVNRIKPNEIAVVSHEDIDEVAAESLVHARVKAVINSKSSITGRYPNPGPSVLINAGITVIDNVGEEIFYKLKENDVIEIKENKICLRNQILAEGTLLNKDIITKKLLKTKENLEKELQKFVNNTLKYIEKEKEIFFKELDLPKIDTKIKNRHVLVVIRGQNYLADLRAIKSYIEEVKPVLIGVDGGGDALLEFGLIPDIIFGDMDSVSDKCLKVAKEIIVHAYPDGKAPGLFRVNKLGLKTKVFPCAGTSEDAVLLLAFEKGAELIVAVGTHSNLIDFLEKGRKGMASTFLVRLKVGSILVDAKGVNKLYRSQIKARYLWMVVYAALLPIIIIGVISEPIQNLLRLLYLQIKVVIGF
ncbi:MAG: hypothetical protein PWP21_196 [Thermosediminibacterales bacterium]|nr:hypothetical protein [Thermosediminibacterales bacterium]